MSLKQGSCNLVQYDQEFNKLMRFGPGQVSTEKDQIKKFRNGMKFSLQTALSTHKFETYNDLLDTTLTLERAQKQQEEYRNRDNKKRHFQNFNSQNQNGNGQNKQFNNQNRNNRNNNQNKRRWKPRKPKAKGRMPKMWK